MVRDTAGVSTQSWGLLPVVVPRQGYRGRPMIGCAFVDPLGVDVVCRQGLLSGWHGAYVLGKFSR
jgi:hypothetical protein